MSHEDERVAYIAANYALHDENAALLARLEEAERLLQSLRREHAYVEDCWYSCPKAPDGCCNESQGDACNCGADAVNARIDAFLAGVAPLDNEKP